LLFWQEPRKLIEVPRYFEAYQSTGGNRKRKERDSLADVIEVRLPPAPAYLPLLRATVGVLAGIMSFNYDEIIQLRVAISEAFNLAIRWAAHESSTTSPDEILMRFVVAPDRIEILVPKRPGSIGQIDIEREEESCALLESLMDDVEFGGGATKQPLISMTKLNIAGTG